MVERSVTEMLEQGLRFLDELVLEDYVGREEMVFGASIGSHYRHILDHVEMILRGAGEGAVNYDARYRDVRVEECLDAARAKTQVLLEAWGNLREEKMAEAIEVVSQVSYREEGAARVGSSVGREAMFATIHGVHHFALIGVICRLRGPEVKEAFGLAPSTVAHVTSA